MQEDFLEAKNRIESLTQRPDNDELLKLYALFKQATEGDITGDRPGGFDFKAAAKFRAWEKEKGKTAEKAISEYIAFSKTLVEKYS